MSDDSPLTKARERAGVPLREMGEAVGRSHSTVSRWESKNQVPEEHQETYADVIGVKLEELKEIMRGRYVDSEGDVLSWYRAVGARRDLQADDVLVLAALPLEAFLNEETWTVSITTEQLVDELPALDPDRVEAALERVLDSDLVERVGDVRYTLRLTFPKTENSQD